jgi:hypothetical protein
MWRACDDLKHAGLTEDFISQALLEATRRGAFSWVRTEERDFLIERIQRPWPSGCASAILHSTALLQFISVLRSAGNTGLRFSEEKMFVPDHIMAGEISLLGSENSPFDTELATAVLWLLHILLGDVTPASANTAVEFFRALPRECSLASIFGGVSFEMSPAIDLIYAAIEKGGDWEAAGHALVIWGGKKGAVRWRQLCDVLVKRLLDTPAVERPQSSDDFMQILQGNASPDQMILDIPAELYPALTDYAWNLALRNRTDRYAVDSAVFEQAIRHLLDSHSVPSVLRDLATRLYTDMPHWMRNPELHALRLGMLTTLLNSPYAAGNVDVIPIALRSCLESGDVPDSIVRAACAAVGRSDEIRRSNIIRLPGPHNSVIYRKLLEIVFSVTDPQSREGALLMIRDNSYMHSYHSSISGGSGTRIRVKGFARMHRTLAKSKVPMERNAGLSLFAVRAPKTREDWSILYDAILSCRDQQTTTSVRIAFGVNASSEDGRNLSDWISFMERCLQHVEYPPLQALITDRLDELLASQDQSLHHYEEEFGLPLSGMTS